MAATETRPKGQTKMRHIRIPDKLWADAAQKAEENGESISEVVRHLLRNYVERD